jgi:hypothetical protein
MNQNEWVENRRKLIRKLSAIVPEKPMEQLVYLSLLGEVPPNDVDLVLNAYLPQLWNSDNPVLESPSSDFTNPEVDLGVIYQGDIPIGPFKLPISFFTRHLAIYGMTGHAKTTVFYHLQDQFINKGVHILSFDTKQDGRALLSRFDQLAIIPWQHFPWNPLRNPPGMPLKTWWNNFSQICGFSWGWFVASSNYLHQHLDVLYDRYQETKTLPTLHQLHASIAHTTERSRRKSEYHDSVENRISTVASIFGETVNVEVGIPLEELCTHSCIVALSGLRPAEQNWVVEVILSWIYFYRMYQDHRGEALRQVIFVDECHRIFDKAKEMRQTAIEMGVPIISIFPSQFRDFGTGLVLASQQPSQIMNAIHANTLVKIVGNLSSGIDIEAISDAMGLDDDTIDYIHRLKRAHWIVRMSDGWTEPFLIQTPDYPIDRNITDDAVLSRLQAVFGKYLNVDKAQKKPPQPQAIRPQLSENAWTMLFDINKHPFRGAMKGVSTRYHALGFSGRTGKAAIDELLEKIFIKEIAIPLGGRPQKFQVLTPTALNTLEAQDYDTRLWRHIGHMGYEHQLYTTIIYYVFKRVGYKTSIEKTIRNGRRIDVLTVIDDKRIGIEVELGPTVDIQTKLLALDEIDELIILIGKDTNIHDHQLIKLPDTVTLFEIHEYLRFLKTNYYTHLHGKKPKNSPTTKKQLNACKKGGKKRKK